MKAPDLRAGMWRVLCCMLLLALLLIASIAPVHAAPVQITGTFVGTDVGRDVTYTFAGKVQTHWAGSLFFDVDNGPRVHVFCIQIQVAVRRGDRYRSDGSVTKLVDGCKILYLLVKYPASTATTPDEGAARQLAIWVFSDQLDPNTITDPAVRSRTIALVNEAKAGQCPAQRIEAPNLTITPPNASAVVGQAVNYTVQAGPQDAGATATVTVTGPATLANGQQQGKVVLDAQGAAPFAVSINGVGNVTVQVTLPYRLSAGIVLSQLDPNVKTQRLVDAGNLDRVATAVAHVSVTAPTAVITPTAAPAPQPSPTPPPPPPPPPTHRPSKPKPTQTPEAAPVAEQPTAIAEQPTETATIDTSATATANQPTSAQPVSPPAGGAPQPVQLPNTGDSTDSTPGIVLGIVAVLFAGGWRLRRRGQRS